MTLPQFGQLINRQDAAPANGGNGGGAPDYPEATQLPVTRWRIPGWAFAAVGAVSLSSGRLYYIPCFVPMETTYIRIGVEVSTSQPGLARIGIYNWTDGIPDTLLLDAGTVDVSSGGDKEIVISQTMARGYYFLAVVADIGAVGLLGPNTGSAVKTPLSGHGSSPGASMDAIIMRENGRVGDVAGGLPATAPLTTLATESMSFATVFLREN